MPSVSNDISVYFTSITPVPEVFVVLFIEMVFSVFTVKVNVGISS